MPGVTEMQLTLGLTLETLPEIRDSLLVKIDVNVDG